MDYQEGYSELVRECGFQFEEAYAIATKKLAECRLDEHSKGIEDMDYWSGIKGMLAEDIASKNMLANGYAKKKIGVFYYFEKERQEEKWNK